MNPAAKPSSALLVAAVLTLACGADPAPTPTKVDAPPAEKGPEAVAKEGPEVEAGGPRLAADEAVHDFGGIKPTDTAEHVFTIRNAGDADLKIDRVQKT